jgi:hypothetical protein
MKKIQEEIDRVVGSDRAPTWEDEMNLPYLRASIKGSSPTPHGSSQNFCDGVQ